MKRQLGVDLTPLRQSPAYRRLYIAGLVTAIGSQATYVTIPYQIKVLTHSTLDVGAIGLVELVPLVVCGLYGGVLADRWDRRRLIISMEIGLMMCAAGAFINALLTHPLVWVLYVVAFFTAALSSIQRPSIEAFNQSSVSHDLQKAAAALATLRSTSASIIGPVLGGLVAVSLGSQWVYGANIVTFTASLVLLSGLAPMPVVALVAHAPRTAMYQGWLYVRSRPDIVGTYIVDIIAMTFAFPVAMLPFVAAQFHQSYALALLYCGLPTGALIAALTAQWTHHIRHYGRAVVAAAAAWGLGIVIFGLTSSLAICVAGLIVAGAADSISGIFRAQMWNESIPPEMRGRMAGMEMISYSLGPTAGQFRAGVMAAWTTLRISLTAGGLACSGGVAVVALALPRLWAFDATTDVHIAQVRELRSDLDEMT